MTQVRGRAVPVEGVRFSDLRAMNKTWQVDGAGSSDAKDRPIAGACWAARWRGGSGAHPGGELTLFGEPFQVAGIFETGGEEEDRAWCAWRCCSASPDAAGRWIRSKSAR